MSQSLIPVTKLRKFPGSEWLTDLDNLVSVNILNDLGSSNFLEIGVWRGAWSFSMLENCSSTVGMGIDPYPGFEHIKSAVTSDIVEHGFSSRFKILNSFADLEDSSQDDVKFSLIHIDGEHSQAAANSDLRSASRRLAPGGVIVVDDFRHLSFPGVTAAVFNFLNSSEFCAFCLTPNKIYICEKTNYNLNFNRVLNFSKKLGIEFETLFKSTGTYDQENSINGFQQIILKSIYYKSKSKVIIRCLKMLLPPLLTVFLRRVYQKTIASLGFFRT